MEQPRSTSEQILSEFERKQQERYKVLDAEYFRAGEELEKAEKYWTVGQATMQVRTMRTRESIDGALNDADLLSGVGYVAVSHLEEQGFILKVDVDNSNFNHYHTIPQNGV